MLLNVQCHKLVTLPPGKGWGPHYTEGLWTPCSFSCCWRTAVYNMKEWMKWISKTRVNKLRCGFYSHNRCQLLCLSVPQSVSLSVFVSSCFENWLTTYFRFVDSAVCSQSAIQINLYQIPWHLKIKPYLLVPLHESHVFSSVLPVLIQTPETYMTLHSSALRKQ